MAKIIPFGDRLIVNRRKVGEKIGKGGILVAPNIISDRPTDLADVKYVPDLTFGDKAILDNAKEIIKNLSTKAAEGNSECLIALLRLNEFLKIKSIKVGDAVMISKYVGMDFSSNEGEATTLVNAEDIIGLII
jgi:co-chaperonin GroES (HSP10)